MGKRSNFLRRERVSYLTPFLAAAALIDNVERTTCLAAHYLGRDSIMIELNPDYIDIAENRFREADGLTLDLRKVA